MAMAGSASATEDVKLNGFYAGAGLANVKVTGALSQQGKELQSKNIPEIHIGYEFQPNVSVEYRRYIKNFKGNDTQVINQATVYGTHTLKNMQSLLMKVKGDYGKANFGVIGGYTMAKLNSVFLNTPTIPNAFPNQTTVDNFNLRGFTYGVTAGYNFTKNVSVNAEYMRLFNSHNVKARTFGTNIEYRF